MQWHGFEELFSHFCVAGWMFVSCDRFKNDMQARQWLLRLKVPLSILRKEVYEREQKYSNNHNIFIPILPVSFEY